MICDKCKKSVASLHVNPKSTSYCLDCMKKYYFDRYKSIKMRDDKEKEEKEKRKKEGWCDKNFIGLDDIDRKLVDPHILNYAFKSFVDIGTGIEINSLSQKKEIEKKYGISYMSMHDRNATQKEAKQYVEHKKSVKIRKAITNIFERVEQGHSYIEEMKKKRG